VFARAVVGTFNHLFTPFPLEAWLAEALAIHTETMVGAIVLAGNALVTLVSIEARITEALVVLARSMDTRHRAGKNGGTALSAVAGIAIALAPHTESVVGAIVRARCGEGTVVALVARITEALAEMASSVRGTVIRTLNFNGAIIAGKAELTVAGTAQAQTMIGAVIRTVATGHDLGAIHSGEPFLTDTDSVDTVSVIRTVIGA
jgi:hypothetical protein